MTSVGRSSASGVAATVDSGESRGAERAPRPKRLVVLVSGRGSNLEALLKARLPATIDAVISNVPGVRALETAEANGIAAVVVDHKEYADGETFGAALACEIDRCGADLIVLAGFMRVLARSFVQRYRGRMLNIHPSLLPAFPGLHTHRRALEAGVRVHGCTVHFVTAEVDGGPIVAQAAVPVHAGDTEESLGARVLAQEHRIYPEAVRWFCQGRVRLSSEGAVEVAGAPAADGALLSPSLG